MSPQTVGFWYGVGVTIAVMVLFVVASLVSDWAQTKIRARKMEKVFQEATSASSGGSWVIPPPEDEEAILGAIRRPIRPEQPVPAIPQFGQPEVATYQPSEHPDLLACSVGLHCDQRVFQPGEKFLKIPVLNSDDGEFIALCSRDVVMMRA
jgi:hypothetical protein